MKRQILKSLFFIFFLMLVGCSFADTRVFFSPSPRCEKNIVRLIDGSREKIDAAVYAINNEDIVEALKRAEQRGVKIRILTDRLQASNKKSKVRELYEFGINIRVHSKNKIEHNKFSIYDGEIAASGSYNWTEPATKKNSENCVFFIDDKDTVKEYQDRFDYLWQINTKKKSDAWFHKKAND